MVALGLRCAEQVDAIAPSLLFVEPDVGHQAESALGQVLRAVRFIHHLELKCIAFQLGFGALPEALPTVCALPCHHKRPAVPVRRDQLHQDTARVVAMP